MATGNGAPPQRPAPCVQMRAKLAICRRAGLPFETAWARSIRTVSWPYDTDQRREWRYALRESRAEFRAAYEGRESPAGRAVLFRDFDPETFFGAQEADMAGMVVASAL